MGVSQAVGNKVALQIAKQAFIGTALVRRFTRYFWGDTREIMGNE